MSIPAPRRAQTIISFDIKKVTSFEDASAPFILYNGSRMSSVLRKFEARARLTHARRHRRRGGGERGLAASDSSACTRDSRGTARLPQERVAEGVLPALPALEAVDTAAIDDPKEWEARAHAARSAHAPPVAQLRSCGAHCRRRLRVRSC